MSLDRIMTAYDVVADAYENRFIDELEAKPRDRELLEHVASGRAGVVLDVGCGPGQIGAHLQGRGRRVVGVDVSLAMAVKAHRRLTSAVVADMLALPFHDGAVAAVVAFYSVIHLQRSDLRRAVEEFARVLQPGGQLLVSAHEGEGEVVITEFLGSQVDLGAAFFRLQELVDAAVASRLEVTTAERRPPYPNEGTTVRLYIEAAKSTG